VKGEIEMYTVTIMRKNKESTSQFSYKWQAMQYAEMFLDCDPVVRDPDGEPVKLYAKCNDSEY
jgi:hypothetical protein